MKEGSHLISSKMDQSYLEYEKKNVPEAWQVYFEDVYARLEKNHSLSREMQFATGAGAQSQMLTTSLSYLCSVL